MAPEGKPGPGGVMSMGEKTLAEVQAEFSWLDCWRGACGLYYARPKGETGEVLTVGEDPQDLSDMIVRALARRENAAWAARRHGTTMSP